MRQRPRHARSGTGRDGVRAQPRGMGRGLALCALALAALLAGCLDDEGQPADPSGPGAGGDGGSGDAGGASSPAPPGQSGGDAPVPSAAGVTMDGCFHLLGFVPMEWAAAERLLPPGFTPLTWTVEEDQSLAVLEVLFVECAAVTVDGQAIGPASSLWLQPDVASDAAPLLDQNNFHAYGAHSHEALVAHWQAYGRAELGAFEVLQDLPGYAAVVRAAAPSLEGSITFTEGDAVTGDASSTWRVFAADGSFLDMVWSKARATFGGSLQLTLAKAPFPLAGDAPAALTAGFGNGHGPVGGLTFTPGTA